MYNNNNIVYIYSIYFTFLVMKRWDNLEKEEYIDV